MTVDDHFTVVVVGGAGGMGRHAVRALARLGTADRILIADLDIDRAQRLADEVGPTATATELDATDPVAMHHVFTGCNIVLNTMGPFARFGTPDTARGPRRRVRLRRHRRRLAIHGRSPRIR